MWPRRSSAFTSAIPLPSACNHCAFKLRIIFDNTKRISIIIYFGMYKKFYILGVNRNKINSNED